MEQRLELQRIEYEREKMTKQQILEKHRRQQEEKIQRMMNGMSHFSFPSHSSSMPNIQPTSDHQIRFIMVLISLVFLDAVTFNLSRFFFNLFSFMIVLQVHQLSRLSNFKTT